MSTLSHSLQSIGAKRLTLVEPDSAVYAEPQCAPEDDGLGCMRGFAVVLACNAVLALLVAGGWELWRLLR